DNDKALLLGDTAGSTDVTEGGATDSYSVTLSMQPTTTVYVEPYNVSSAQLTFSPASLAFSTTNYNVPQVITVTALDDSAVEGYHTQSIGHTVTNYGNTNREQVAPTSLTANISDNDSRVVITETGGGTTVREGGAITDTYTVYLLTAPTGHVSVTIGDGMYLWQDVPTSTAGGHDVTFTTADTTTATSTVTLTFTPSNYATAQVVTVTAYDDTIKEGVEKIAITHHVRSVTSTGSTTTTIDSNYNETGANRVVATVLDNEAGLATLGADFDGDGKTDYAIFRASTSQFFVKKSASNSTDVVTWGDSAQSDRPVPADYDGDGKSDHAIFRPATAQFFVKKSSTGAAEVVTWGMANGGDKPAVGDFDGDGKIDYVVFRPSTAQFFVKNSADSSVSVVTWGISNGSDTPVVADYDGDGKADYAIYRRSLAQWFIKQSSNLATTVITWGEATSADIPVAGDYDGDGKADAAIYRPSTAQFFVRQSTTTTAAVTTWGIAAGGDVPVPGDYDGDGKTDKAIFRPSLAMFIVQKSSTLTVIDPPVTWGVAGGADYPLPVPDPNSDGTVYGFLGS
ncbi:MAG: VCBS repeat-containing protein, partial [Chloroflexi bacterium]|nr:VCBS repeat-containing protein [Chloroflexota bacterium]